MNILPPLLYRGSVKNVRGEVSDNFLLFEFSDRYSIFDWGEMPDLLDGKGRALSIMGKAFFLYLENPKNWQGLFENEIIKNKFDPDYLSKLENSDLYKHFCSTGLPHHASLENEYPWDSPYLKVKNVNVLRPIQNPDHSYNYEPYKTKLVNTLVPLEIIFRIGLAKGNSLTKRLGQDLTKWKEFGFSHIPNDSELLKIPMIDFSTKLERGDRYLDYVEAKRIAGLNDHEWSELHQMTQLVALNLFFIHHKMGLELWDGKIEVAFIEGVDGQRSFMLVDSVGIDELRLLYKGKSFSKEFLRETYKESIWYKNLEASKKESQKTGIDFKEICRSKYNSTPSNLEMNIKLRAQAVYKSYCNSISKLVGKDFPFDFEFTFENYSSRYL